MNLGWGKELGTIYGLPLICEYKDRNIFYLDNRLITVGSTETTVESLTKTINLIPETIERLKQSLDGAYKTLKAEPAPFPHTERLKEVNQRLKEIHDIIFKAEEAAPSEDANSEVEDELEQPEHDVILSDKHSLHYLKNRELPEWAYAIKALMPAEPESNIIPFPVQKEIEPLKIITPNRFEAVTCDESVLQGCLF